MSKDKESFDRKQKKTAKIMAFIVAPILFMIVGLMIVFDVTEEEEVKPAYSQILSQVDLKCYNINWFGQHGFQITFKESIEELAMKLDEYDMDFANNEFFNDQEVIDWMVINCPHLDSRLQIPEVYDPMLGNHAVDQCLIKKEGVFEKEEYCLQFKS